MHNEQEKHLINGFFRVYHNIHLESKCQGRPCVIHWPTKHHMRTWRLHYRDDRNIFERICAGHGVGHPDPDQYHYWAETNQEWQAVHGCCGCCNPSQEDK